MLDGLLAAPDGAGSVNAQFFLTSLLEGGGIMRFMTMARNGLSIAALTALSVNYCFAAGSGKEEGKPSTEGKTEVTSESLAKFTEGYIKEKSKDGVFSVYDRITKKTLALTLDKVHDSKLRKTKPDEHLVCADLKDNEGKVYDVDFFVKQTGQALKIDKRSVKVHKIAGEERYSWKLNETKGVYESKKGGSAKEQPKGGSKTE